MSDYTVGRLIEELKVFDPDQPVYVGPKGYFSILRTKGRGNEVQIEICEALGVEYDLLPEHPLRQKGK